MKRIFLIALIAGLAGFNCIGSAHAATLKIGIIDTGRIMAESRAAKEARAIFLKDLEAKRGILNARQNEVRGLEEELKKEGTNFSPQIRKEKTDNLAKELKELKRLKDDLEEELKRKEAELNRRLIMEIRDVVTEYQKKEKFTVILEKRMVVASDDAADITEKIIRLYDTVK
ncbi:MAG: OmpH family outer membrane protein [Deltaproteobacteria bacterium]|nr:OmpH family outer membrane protein [Deltaproteobacteria bacterium]